MTKYVIGFRTQCTLIHLLQQSLNVLECREFRDLLQLLCEDLREQDIPHRTKIREAIIVAWKDYFNGLKHELAVSATFTPEQLLFRNVRRWQSGKSVLQGTCGQTQTCVHF